jgi:hypothetical protein
MREPMMNWFPCGERPTELQPLSNEFYSLADIICQTIAPGPERTVALRKLLESKDSALRAKLNPGA